LNIFGDLLEDLILILSDCYLDPGAREQGLEEGEHLEHLVRVRSRCQLVLKRQSYLGFYFIDFVVVVSFSIIPHILTFFGYIQDIYIQKSIKRLIYVIECLFLKILAASLVEHLIALRLRYGLLNDRLELRVVAAELNHLVESAEYRVALNVHELEGRAPPLRSTLVAGVVNFTTLGFPGLEN
jgi:hypothetical protein